MGHEESKSQEGNAGYSPDQAKAISGATQRQLQYWDEVGLVRASVLRGKGKGSLRRYSYADLLQLRVIVELRSAGISLQKIRKVVQALRTEDPNSRCWAQKRLVAHGDDVYITTSDGATLRSLLHSGQLAFSVVLLGSIAQEVKKRIRLYTAQRAAG